MNLPFATLSPFNPHLASWRVVTRIYGGLLGPEFIVCADGKYFRVGALTIRQLKRGIPASELDLLEVDQDTYEAL